MIPRPDTFNQIKPNLKAHPITALLGPRQCGKTTLARIYAEQEPAMYFDLENPVDVRRLSTPKQTLEKLEGLVIIDEVQRKPKLFELLRVLVDRPENPARFLLLGSASPGLVKGVSESLEGRIGFVDLSGFFLREVDTADRDRLWLRGGFPRSFLAKGDAASFLWRENFIRTFLERDIPQLGIAIPADTLRRFWMMAARWHGQPWNAAEFARSLGSSETTARRYLNILSGIYMLRVLPAWYENIRKRQVKAPKIYVRDSGLLHGLLQIQTMDVLRGNPKIGASWKGFALEHVIDAFKTRDFYFWATHAGAELDLMLIHAGRRYGFEFKYSDAPRRKRSMHIAIHDLNLEHLYVIYPGKESYPLSENITVTTLESIYHLKKEIEIHNHIAA